MFCPLFRDFVLHYLMIHLQQQRPVLPSHVAGNRTPTQRTYAKTLGLISVMYKYIRVHPVIVVRPPVRVVAVEGLEIVIWTVLIAVPVPTVYVLLRPVEAPSAVTSVDPVPEILQAGNDAAVALR